MDMSDWSHLAKDRAFLTLTASPSYSSSAELVQDDSGFNIDDWLDFSSGGIDLDESQIVLSPAWPTVPGTSFVSDGNSNLMKNSTVRISPVFTTTSDNPSWPPPDVVLLSTDAVVFYVNQFILLRDSANSFRSLLPILSQDKTKRICFVEECSNVLNTILHIFYDISNSATCFSDAATLLKAVDRLPVYGIPVKSRVYTSSLYALLVSQAPLIPYEFYAFAAHHGIEDLAVAVSPYTLQQPLWAINNNERLVERMGPDYLKRLLELHLERRIAFEQSLMAAPPLHDITKSCAFKDNRNMTNAWVEGAERCLERVAERGGELLSSEVRAIFDLALRGISCEECQKAKEDHLNKVLMQRSLARRTI